MAISGALIDSKNRIFRSDVLEGFRLDVEWLFADKLPNEFEKLQQILNS